MGRRGMKRAAIVREAQIAVTEHDEPLRDAQKRLEEAKGKLNNARELARKHMAPLLVSHFGSVVFRGLRDESERCERDSPEDGGWVMGPNQILFRKRWNAPASRKITAACDKLDISRRDALRLIMDGLVKAGRVEDEDGSIFPDEEFGGYSVYRLPRT